LAEWAPLLLTPDMKPPRFETWRARYISSLLECMISRNSRSGMIASATTRLPRVRSMLIWLDFLSVAKLPSRKKRSIPSWCFRIQWHAAWVALPVMFCPAASPVV
jgi:hypothetical protein